jgi:hypothetical protein
MFAELEKQNAGADEPCYVGTFDPIDFPRTWDPIENSSFPSKVPCTWDPLEVPAPAPAPVAQSQPQMRLFQPQGLMFQPAVVATVHPAALVSQQSPQQPSSSTTMMLRKLPRHFTLERLISVLNSEGLRGSYDFLYLPRDMKTRKSFTYCFINWITPALAQAAMRRFDGYKLDGAVLTTQWVVDCYGLQTQIEKHRNKPYMHPNVPQEFKPMVFQNGCLVEFPKPTQEITMPQLGHH